MKKTLDMFLNSVDQVNRLVAKGLLIIIPIIMFIIVYEVISRYLFNAPTIWAWDINLQLFSMMVFLGGGFVLLENGHVNVDILYAKFNKRQKAFTDIVTSPVFFIYSILLLRELGNMAMISITEREVDSTVLALPLYPLKVVITIGSFLLLMQGIAKFIRSLRVLFSRSEAGAGCSGVKKLRQFIFKPAGVSGLPIEFQFTFSFDLKLYPCRVEMWRGNDR